MLLGHGGAAGAATEAVVLLVPLVVLLLIAWGALRGGRKGLGDDPPGSDDGDGEGGR